MASAVFDSCAVYRQMQRGVGTAIQVHHDPALAMHHLLVSSYMSLQVMQHTCMSSMTHMICALPLSAVPMAYPR